MNTHIKMEAPKTNLIDWTTLGVVWSTLIALVAVLFKWIKTNNEAKKLEKETFIKSVVQNAMAGILNEFNDKIKSTITDMNEKITTLFEYRENDRANLDRKFETIMKELKK